MSQIFTQGKAEFILFKLLLEIEQSDLGNAIMVYNYNLKEFAGGANCWKNNGQPPATENEACVMAREETFNVWKIITPTFQFYVFMCVYVCADHESHPLAGPHPAWGHHHPALQFPEGQGYSGYPENDENHRQHTLLYSIGVQYCGIKNALELFYILPWNKNVSALQGCPFVDKHRDIRIQT